MASTKNRELLFAAGYLPAPLIDATFSQFSDATDQCNLQPTPPKVEIDCTLPDVVNLLQEAPGVPKNQVFGAIQSANHYEASIAYVNEYGSTVPNPRIRKLPMPESSNETEVSIQLSSITAPIREESSDDDGEEDEDDKGRETFDENSTTTYSGSESDVESSDYDNTDPDFTYSFVNVDSQSCRIV